MDYLIKLVTIALEWTYQAGEQDVKAETLEKAAALLVLRRDTLRIIDGAGPSIEVLLPEQEQESMLQAKPDETVILDLPNQQTLSHDEMKGTQMEEQSLRCSFSGPITLDAVRLMQSTILEVQCPSCGSVSKAKVKGQSVVISPHPPRKSRPVRNITRWAEQETQWVLIQKKV
jgi:hypothetical protein